MSLARVFTTLSSTFIRKLGEAGGPRADQVGAELDNIIAWAKDAPRCIHRNTATIGNVGTGLDSLHSFSLPANSLATNGDYLDIWYGGLLAANDNDKRIVASIDAQNYEDPGAVLDQDGGAWTLDVRIIRLSATSVRVSSMLNVAQTYIISGPTIQNETSYRVARNADKTVANLNSNAVTLLVQGETAVASNNDVVQNLSIIKLCQQ